MMLPSASLTLTPRGSEGGQTGACSSDASGSNHSLDCRLVHVRGKVGGMWRAFCNAPTPTHVTARRLVRRADPVGVRPWRRGGLCPHSSAGRRRRGRPLMGLAPSSWPRGAAGPAHGCPRPSSLAAGAPIRRSRPPGTLSRLPGSCLPALIPPGGGKVASASGTASAVNPRRGARSSRSLGVSRLAEVPRAPRGGTRGAAPARVGGSVAG